MDLTSLSVTGLNALSKAQIITALTEDRTETKTIVSTGDKRGQFREVRETKDLAGKLLSSQEVNWTYFKAGNVDTITTINKDANGNPVGKPQIVKHNESGGLKL